MLILTRKPGESIVIGNTIRLTVLELSRNSVRFGFDAPAEVSIYRQEIHDEIARVNRGALDETEAAGS